MEYGSGIVIQREQPPVGRTFVFITGFIAAARAALLLSFRRFLCVSHRVFTIFVPVCVHLLC